MKSFKEMFYEGKVLINEEYSVVKVGGFSLGNHFPSIAKARVAIKNAAEPGEYQIIDLRTGIAVKNILIEGKVLDGSYIKGSTRYDDRIKQKEEAAKPKEKKPKEPKVIFVRTESDFLDNYRILKQVSLSDTHSKDDLPEDARDEYDFDTTYPSKFSRKDRKLMTKNDVYNVEKYMKYFARRNLILPNISFDVSSSNDDKYIHVEAMLN